MVAESSNQSIFFYVGCMRRRVGWRGRREEKRMEREKREEVPYNT